MKHLITEKLSIISSFSFFHIDEYNLNPALEWDDEFAGRPSLSYSKNKFFVLYESSYVGNAGFMFGCYLYLSWV